MSSVPMCFTIMMLILRGGTRLTVTGQFIDSVAEPELLVTGVSRAQTSVDVTATTSAITVDKIYTGLLAPAS